jgi:aspartate-semialdehyde dehydrogenase
VSPPAARSTGRRIVIYGVTGQLGRELVEDLDASGWPIAELVGVATPTSLGQEFEFRGEALDVVAEAPVLKGRDLVIVCTPRGPALEIVREALRAEVPCIDCSGALAAQAAVPLAHPSTAGLESAPLVTVPASTTLTLRPLLEAVAAAAGLTRVSATLLGSASAWGRDGVAALSDESIALFNQSESPEPGPAGRPVAFDVAPGGAIDLERVSAELRREHGATLGLALSSVQVPTFVGEGALVGFELERGLASGKLEEILAARRELVASAAPSLRDALGAALIRIGPLEVDAGGASERAYRIWLASDPLRLVADAALRAAGRRLGLDR